MDVLAPVLAKYKRAQDSNRLLYINFNSLSSYMWVLRAACEFMVPFEKRAVLYLAAAVSDFYVPSDEMPTHKIQVNFYTILLFIGNLQNGQSFSM